MPALALAVICAFVMFQTPPNPSPLASPTAAPRGTPMPSPAPSSSSSPSPAPTPVALPADAPPQIVDVQLSSTTLHGGDTFNGKVVTSTNVASLEVRMAGQSIDVPRTDYGVFALSYQVPRIPFFARGNYTAQIIARNAKGDQAERDVSIALR